MTKYSKFNIIYRLQKWLDSVPGQTFMNYAYSWGASIVILGTLFKLTHLPGANFMLFLGMGTEVVVFFIAAFDRPFDKTADGMELPTHGRMLARRQSIRQWRKARRCLRLPLLAVVVASLVVAPSSLAVEGLLQQSCSLLRRQARARLRWWTRRP